MNEEYSISNYLDDITKEAKDGRILRLVEKLEEYIGFLHKANEGAITMAYVHGWRCPQEYIDKGILFRKEIEELRERL